MPIRSPARPAPAAARPDDPTRADAAEPCPTLFRDVLAALGLPEEFLAWPSDVTVTMPLMWSSSATLPV